MYVCMYAYRPSISAPLLVFPQLAAIAAEAGRLGEGGKRKEERERERVRAGFVVLGVGPALARL